MKHRSTIVSDRIQCGVISVLLRDELRTPEAILWAATPWDKNGAIVDSNGNTLF